MHLYRKPSAVITALILLLPSCSCGKKVPEDEKRIDLLDTAYTYCDLLCRVDAEEFYSYNDSTYESVEEYWENRLSLEENFMYSAEEAMVYRTVADTMDYTLDESSVVLDGDVGHVTVDFTMKDYDDLQAYYPFWDEWERYVGLAATAYHHVVIDFVMEDGYWYCSNYRYVYETLYDFTLKEFVFAEHIEDISADVIIWRNTDADGYLNTDTLSPYMLFDYYVPSDYNSISLELFYEGESVVYLPHTYQVDLHIEAYPELTDPSGHYFREGEYTAYCYDYNGDVIASGSIDVAIEYVPVVVSPELNWDYDNGNARYQNADHIRATLEYEGDLFVGETRYEIIYDNEVIATGSGTLTADIWLDNDEDGVLPRAEDPAYFAPGSYTIVFYDGEDNVLVRNICSVTYRP